MKSHQVVMVTGASAGLGRSIAHEFAKRGAWIGLIARNREALEACGDEVRELGGEALVLPLDVSDAASMEHAANRLEEAFGPMDVWVNNAVASVFSPVRKMIPEEYKRVTEVSYLGYVYGTQSALRRMLARDSGTIIQVSSALAGRGIPLQSAYCGAKRAISGFTESLQCELDHDKSNVHATVVHMPAMNTTQFAWMKNRLPEKPRPVSPIFQPEVVAKVVAHVAGLDRPRREYWVGSPAMQAIIGQILAPSLLNRSLGDIGYDAQQTDVPEDPDRLDNLWDYVPGRHDAHGPFDKQAHSFSTQVFMELHHNWFVAAGTALVTAAVVGWKKNHRSRKETSDVIAVEDRQSTGKIGRTA